MPSDPRRGQLVHDGTVWRRWNGCRWAIAAASARPARLGVPIPLDEDPVLTTAARSELLDKVVQEQTLYRRAVVVSRDDTTAVLGYRRPVMHPLHALLTVLTGGFWAIIWVIAVLSAGQNRRLFTVDEWGHAVR